MKRVIVSLFIFIIGFIMFFAYLYQQELKIDDNVNSITIYDDLTYYEGAKYNIEDLSKHSKYTIHNPTLTYNNDIVLWHGDNLGILKLDNGDTLKVRISVYGDFFAFAGKKGYYTYK